MQTTTITAAVRPSTARRPFGFGLTTRPVRDNTAKVRPYSDADAAWWAAESRRLEEAEHDTHLDALAAESRGMALIADGIGW